MSRKHLLQPKLNGVPLEAREDELPEQRVQEQDSEVRGIYFRRDNFKAHGWTK